MKQRLLILLLLFGLATCLSAQALPRKREFRGVWLQTAYNEEYMKLGTQAFQDTLRSQLDRFQALGINTIIFQVRPEGDAFYASELEPWSRFLTGKQGQAPEPFFDPMAFLIEECHQRCMEFHAWINPYRANINKKHKLCKGHRYYEKRYLFISYGNQLLYNPGIPENREFIASVVKDIVSRYDVDAIHMDDYFYPYPLRGLQIPDNPAFKKYGYAEGFDFNQLDDWRRNNVNLLIQELSQTIKATKPWVRFGVSPFGIYRNKSQHEGGSHTKGLSNYDDLYADIQLWINNGWIDYVIPQLYWEIGHPAADYTTLLHWWTENKGAHTQLYIGQDVQRSKDQILRKLQPTQEDARIQGNCFWNGGRLLSHLNGVIDTLRMHYYVQPALQPLFPEIDNLPPAKPIHVKMDLHAQEPLLTWQPAPADAPMDKTWYYAIYAFDPSIAVDVQDTRKLLGLTTDTCMVIPDEPQALCYQYAITAIDRLHNESEPTVYQYCAE